MSAAAYKARPTGGAAGEWRKGWPIVFCSALGMGVAVIHSYTLGAFIGPIQQDTGWHRQQIVAGMTIISVISVLMQPIVGILADRFSVRAVALPGLALYGLSMIAISQVGSNLTLWYLAWAMLALGFSSIQSVWITGLAGHFTLARGMAISVALLGTAMSAAVGPFIATLLIEHLGWRGAYMWLAAFPLLVALPCAFAFFTDARTSVRSRLGAPAADAPAPAPPAIPEMTSKQVLRSRNFWQMAVAGGLMTFAITGFAVHAIPILVGLGLSGTSAAALFGWFGIGSLFGRVGTGIFLDRLSAKLVAVVSLAIASAGLIFFLLGSRDPVVLSVAMLMIGFTNGAETGCIAYLTGKYFGLTSFGFAFGAICGFFGLGSGIGPLTGGTIYDSTKDYGLFQIVVLVALGLAGLLIVTLGRYPDEVAEANTA